MDFILKKEEKKKRKKETTKKQHAFNADPDSLDHALRTWQTDRADGDEVVRGGKKREKKRHT
jgi:hypothetical protein